MSANKYNSHKQCYNYISKSYSLKFVAPENKSCQVTLLLHFPNTFLSFFEQCHVMSRKNTNKYNKTANFTVALAVCKRCRSLIKYAVCVCTNIYVRSSAMKRILFAIITLISTVCGYKQGQIRCPQKWRSVYLQTEKNLLILMCSEHAYDYQAP